MSFRTSRRFCSFRSFDCLLHVVECARVPEADVAAKLRGVHRTIQDTEPVTLDESDIDSKLLARVDQDFYRDIRIADTLSITSYEAPNYPERILVGPLLVGASYLAKQVSRLGLGAPCLDPADMAKPEEAMYKFLTLDDVARHVVQPD